MKNEVDYEPLEKYFLNGRLVKDFLNSCFQSDPRDRKTAEELL